MARVVPSHSWRLLLTGALFAGVGSLVAVSPLARRSGAHLNPAVTIAFTCTGYVHPHHLCGYIGAELAGGLAGAGLLRLLWVSRAGAVGFGVTQPRPHTTVAAAVGLDAAMTAVLVLTIFSFVSSPRTARWTRRRMGRGDDPRLEGCARHRDQPEPGPQPRPRHRGPELPPPLDLPSRADPRPGVAVVVWWWVPRRTRTAKPFYGPNYPCTLRTTLPPEQPTAALSERPGTGGRTADRDVRRPGPKRRDGSGRPWAVGSHCAWGTRRPWRSRPAAGRAELRLPGWAAVDGYEADEICMRGRRPVPVR